MRSMRSFRLGLCAALSFAACSNPASLGREREPRDRPDGEEPVEGQAEPKDDGGRKPAASRSDGGRKPSQPPSTVPPTVLEPIAIDHCGADNSAGASAAEIAKLKQGGGNAAGIEWLYPYEGTVFPRGMLAPDLMWNGADAELVYVHIQSTNFEYWGCLKPDAARRITLEQEVWDEAGKRSAGHEDPYTVELSVLQAGRVTGPARSRFQIAQAAIKGSIYYNSYSSKLTGAGSGVMGLPGFPIGGFGGGGNGLVLRIPQGGRAEVLGRTDCNGCHSVSADGSRLLAQSVANGAYSYGLDSSGTISMPSNAGTAASWTALYPDGTAFLSMSTAIDVARTSIFGGLAGTPDATLYDAKTGAKIASRGIPTGALMPSFSPTGSWLVFTDYALAQGRGLALMQYDVQTHTASEYVELYDERTSGVRPGWPFLLPDDRAVVFARTRAGDFTGGGVGVSGGLILDGASRAPFSELSIVDVASKKVTVLARAMGYATPADAESGKTYLPFAAEDLHHTYYPTVSPVASGGYFWIFFDSVRHYGNLGLQRQLWGAAIDISADGSYELDPSHPPFYLTGQEAGTGNHRAFAALDPCHADGDDCTTGIDCCGGYCYFEGAGGEFVEAVGKCTPSKTTCSQLDERCRVSADCCPASEGASPRTCIAGFCAHVPFL